MRVPRPSAADQKKAIEELMFTKQQVVAGDTWYIIAKKWFQDWENYVGSGDEGDAPGPIDNSPLINGDQSLRRGVDEYRDYELLAEEAWILLYQWYAGGPQLPRKAIKLNNRSDPLIVEVRLLTLNFSHKEHGVVTVGASKADTIGDIKNQICNRWDLNASTIEVWDATGTQVENMDKQLAELHVTDGQKINVTDTRLTIGDDTPRSSDSNGAEDVSNQSSSSSISSYPSSSSYSYSSSSSSSSYTPSSSYSYTSYYDQRPKQPPPPPGLVGLNNLGNTCFMNSSLQCLSNTVPLTEFFLSGAYEKDINLENPLGTQGKLAEEFGRLTRELWNGRNSAVAPRDFKSRLERFASQFTGYQQHDSQELLAFLLDGLHEDLNRVKKKLYATVREGDDIPDEERAKEAWDIHKGRNDSVIVDWFQASLKSTLVCPTCDRVSVTFDPFMYLSLPLPMKMDRSVPITLIALEASKPPTKYLVKVPKSGSMVTLKEKLGELSGVPANRLIVTDVFNCKFFKKFADQDSIDSFDEERDVLYAYEIKPQPQSPSSEIDEDNTKIVHCAVYNRKDEARSVHYQASTQLFGTPFFVSIHSNATYGELYEAIFAVVSRWLKKDALSNLQQNADELDVSAESTEGEQNGGEQMNSPPAQHRLFTIQSVDTHGYHDTPLYDNDAQLTLENRTTLAIHWKPDVFEYLEDLKSSVNHSSMHTVDPTDPDGITLDKCMSLYTSLERLGPEDPWYCNRCKEHKQATKKFDLWSAPRILVVHLKRFSYRNKYFREKLETLVSYPLRGLDLSSHIIGPSDTAPIYDLYAVSNHYGSLGGGHYTAYALNKSTNKWYKFDDSYVSEIDESQVVSSSAYVLFYRRRDTMTLSSIPASFSNGEGNGESTNKEEPAESDSSADEMEEIKINRRSSGSFMDCT